MCDGCPLQVLDVHGLKVHHTFILHADIDGDTVQLAEIIHTSRTADGYLMPLECIGAILSRLKDAGGGGPGRCLPHRSLLPTFVLTDKDMALLNAISMHFNGEK